MYTNGERVPLREPRPLFWLSLVLCFHFHLYFMLTRSLCFVDCYKSWGSFTGPHSLSKFRCTTWLWCFLHKCNILWKLWAIWYTDSKYYYLLNKYIDGFSRTLGFWSFPELGSNTGSTSYYLGGKLVNPVCSMEGLVMIIWDCIHLTSIIVPCGWFMNLTIHVHSDI